MNRILVPTDFEKPATWASEAAGILAKKIKAEVILLHIVEQPTAESFNAEGQVEGSELWEDKIYILKLIERAKRQLSAAAGALQEDGVKVKQQLRLGNPFHGIRQVITDYAVDLIVMGTSGHSRFEELLVGSNTEKVVRFSNCPVLTVHKPWPAGNKLENIVYATSLVDSERQFSEVVRKTQEMFGATVHLVRINTPMNFQPDHKVRFLMEEFAHKNKLQRYTLNVFSDLSEEDGINHFSNMINADLIAMATHGRTGFAHVLAGSIAEDVVNHAARPVLTQVLSKV